MLPCLRGRDVGTNVCSLDHVVVTIVAEDINHDARHFGVGVKAGADQVALSSRVYHEELNYVISYDY